MGSAGRNAGVVRTLLADPRTNPGIINRPDGRTALEIATAAGNREAATVLRQRMRDDPGEDRLAPGDHYEPMFEHATLLRGPLRPDPPEPHRPMS